MVLWRGKEHKLLAQLGKKKKKKRNKRSKFKKKREKAMKREALRTIWTSEHFKGLHKHVASIKIEYLIKMNGFLDSSETQS